MCAGIALKIIGVSVSVFDSNIGLNLLRTSFTSLKWRGGFHNIDNVCLRSACESPVQIIGKKMLSVQQGDLHMFF